MQTIGLVFNSGKESAVKIAERLVNFFSARGITTVIPQNLADLVVCSCESVTEENFLCRAEAIVVLGGDGTLLSAARRVAQAEIPLFGINLGTLGFLTEGELTEMDKAMEILISGKWAVEERMMLLGEVIRGGQAVDKFYALNDIVISKGAFARLITIDTYVDQEFLFAYPADGLIISTPTGSTAYSLSAGGPIVHPEMKLMLLTPICPHTLYARPVIVSEKQKIRAVLSTPNSDVMLTIDGQYGIKLNVNDEVLVTSAPMKTRLIKLTEKNFFSILRKKLREGSSKERA